MSAKDTVKTFREIYDRAMNHGDTKLIYEMYSPSFACSNPDYSIDGYDDIEASVERQRKAFPDIDFGVQFISASDDGVAVCWTMAGTHTHELFGVPPSGRQVSMAGITVHELVDGKSIGSYSCSDMVAQMQAALAEAESDGTVPAAG
jgi:steroid delta-isomerase-like uncharacterized protein